MSKEVTRTITRTRIGYTLIDEHGDTFCDVMEVVGKFDHEQAQKHITKKGIIGRVTSVDSVDVIWGITEEDFLKHGHEVTRPASQRKKAEADEPATDDTNN